MHDFAATRVESLQLVAKELQNRIVTWQARRGGTAAHGNSNKNNDNNKWRMRWQWPRCVPHTMHSWSARLSSGFNLRKLPLFFFTMKPMVEANCQAARRQK